MCVTGYYLKVDLLNTGFWVFLNCHKKILTRAISKELCELTGFPDQRPSCSAISKEPCKFTVFPDQRTGWWAISKESCKFTDSLARGQAGGLSLRNHVNLQDSLS